MVNAPCRLSRYLNLLHLALCRPLDQGPARGHVVTVLFTLMLLGCSRPEPDMIVVPLDPGFVQRGESLVHGVAACGFCHGALPEPRQTLSGGRPWYDKYGAVYAPNITPSRSGVGAWNTNQLIDAIRRGVGPEGQMLSPEVHRGYEWMSDDDVLSIIAYLRSTEPIQNEVGRREVPFIDRNTTGFFDRAPEVKGYIPAIERRFRADYGRYLTLHVARCQGCHDGPSNMLGEGGFLEGGRTITTDAGSVVAPGIGPNQIDGLGSWSEQDLVTYLRTGNTVEGRVVDPEFCPIPFYRGVPSEDLEAIAFYLKSLPPDS